MSEIKVVRGASEISDADALISLVQKQMACHGGNGEYERIKRAVLNALKLESRAFFLIWESSDNEIGAFCFCNICSGLESGADYIWVNEFYVDEKYRRRGIAGNMLKFLDSFSKEIGAVYIAGITEAENEIAQSMYRKSGFGLSRPVWFDKTL